MYNFLLLYIYLHMLRIINEILCDNHSDVFKRIHELPLATATNAQVKRELFAEEKLCAGK